MTQTTILSVYPLSAAYAAALQHKFGEARPLTLGELRERRGLGFLKALRGVTTELMVLPLEDENSRALLPIVKIVALLTAAERVVLAGPDLSLTPISRLELVTEIVRLGLATIACLWSSAIVAIELARLSRKPRLNVEPPVKGRVLYLKTNLWFGIKAGGSVGHIAGVANALNRSGYPVTFVSAEPPVMVDADIRTEKVPPPPTFGLPYELNNYRFQRACEKVAVGALSRDSHAFIYQRLSSGNYLGARLSRRFRLPLVVEYNGSEAWIAKNWGRPLRFHRLAVATEQALLKHAHVIVTVSGVLRDELVARGIESERIVVYPNCIDPKVFDPGRFSATDSEALRDRHGIAHDATVCTFVGTFGQWHGAHVLAQAIAQLWTERRDWLRERKLHFMLIGDGLRMREVRDTLNRADAQPVCTLTGLVPQADTPGYLAASDILVSPHVPNDDNTRFFGSPTKLFEYMAMGRGIYASRLEQVGEVLSPALDIAALPTDTLAATTATAVLGRPGDVDALIAGIRFLVDHPDWAAALGTNARTKALNEFTWQHHVEAILVAVDGHRK